MPLYASPLSPDPSCARLSDADGRVVLLAEVDFKWLMAGQGCWIDTERLRTDPAYCATLLGQALASPCAALRECAARLQTLATGSLQRA